MKGLYPVTKYFYNPHSIHICEQSFIISFYECLTYHIVYILMYMYNVVFQNPQQLHRPDEGTKV